jgi:mxaA protein
MHSDRGAKHWLAAVAIATACSCVLPAGVRAAPAIPDATPGAPAAQAAPDAALVSPAAATAPPKPAEPTATRAPPAEPSGAGLPEAIQQPRPFGYVLGDTLTQRILMRSAGQEFEPVAFPPTERAGLWFARRSSKIERGEDGRRWLAIDYQLVNAPQTLMTVNLPAVTLKSKAGAVLAVPEWPISVAPLTPRAAFAKGGLQELRPDHAAPMLPTLKLQRQLEIWLSAFALTVVFWFGWWLVRALRVAANQPFASALREIRRTDDHNAAAWLALHRAFDRTAARALQTTTLPVLFKRAPHFEPQRGAIEQFYTESNQRFFGAAPAGEITTRARRETNATGAITTPGIVGGPTAPGAHAHANSPSRSSTSASSSGGAQVSLRALATTLRRIEKQHER